MPHAVYGTYRWRAKRVAFHNEHHRKRVGIVCVN